MVTYANFMRVVPEEGIPKAPFGGMQRKRYVDIDSNRVVRPTAMGRKGSGNLASALRRY
jgi:hypothetical protein